MEAHGPHFEPEHVHALHAALDAVEASTGVVVGYLDLTRRARAQLLGEEFRSGSCHAGAGTGPGPTGSGPAYRAST
ncbi:MAG: hypothetical protein ACK45F_07300, partial [bacterium]